MKLLSASQIFEKSVYIVGKNESLLSIALALGCTPQFLILDNDLLSEPKQGDILLVKNRGKTFILTNEILSSLTSEQKLQLKQKNKVDYLFIGQILLE